jgi:3-keto-5-aminohexanoate cleavage enzyme
VSDPGSVNFTLARTTAEARPAYTYINPEPQVRQALAFAARHDLPPNLAIYEPGFARAGFALARAAGTRPPLYRLMFSETFAVGFPPKPYALSAYLSLLEEASAQPLWMIAGFSADVRPLIGETVARGGHVRVGLEDAPLGSKKTNLAWVEDAVRLVRRHGGDIASSADVRRDLRAPAANA